MAAVLLAFAGRLADPEPPNGGGDPTLGLAIGLALGLILWVLILAPFFP